MLRYQEIFTCRHMAQTIRYAVSQLYGLHEDYVTITFLSWNCNTWINSYELFRVIVSYNFNHIMVAPPPFLQPRSINMEHYIHSLEFGDNQLVSMCTCSVLSYYNCVICV